LLLATIGQATSHRAWAGEADPARTIRALDLDRRAVVRASKASWVSPVVRAAVSEAHRKLGRFRRQHGGISRAELAGGGKLDLGGAALGSLGGEAGARGYHLSKVGHNLSTSIQRYGDGAKALWVTLEEPARAPRTRLERRLARREGDGLYHPRERLLHSSIAGKPDPDATFTGKPDPDVTTMTERWIEPAAPTIGSNEPPSFRDQTNAVQPESHLAFVRAQLNRRVPAEARRVGLRLVKRIEALERRTPVYAQVRSKEWFRWRKVGYADGTIVETLWLGTGSSDRVALTVTTGDETVILGMSTPGTSTLGRLDLTRMRERDGLTVSETLSGDVGADEVKLERRRWLGRSKAETPSRSM
jgi:hypothetical protein